VSAVIDHTSVKDLGSRIAGMIADYSIKSETAHQGLLSGGLFSVLSQQI
jgi:hypothetical protein